MAIGSALMVSLFSFALGQDPIAAADVFKSIKKSANKTGNDIKKGTNDAVDKTKNTAEDAVKKADDGLDDLGTTFKKAFDKSFKEMEAGYNKSVDLTKKLVLAAQQAYYISTAADYYNDNKAFINHISAKWASLIKDKENKARLDRLMQKAAAKKLDAEAKADMQYFAGLLFDDVSNLSAQADGPPYQKMDIQAAPPAMTVFASTGSSESSGSNYKKPKGIKSFSLSVAAGAGYKVGGGETAFGFVGDLYKEPGKDYDCQGLVSIGGAVGLVNGAQGSVILGFGPTSTAKAAGASFGVEVNFAYAQVGGMVSINWNFTDKDTIEPIPGFSVGYSTGIKAEVAVVGGYAWTFK
jgi:hypothetical protein